MGVVLWHVTMSLDGFIAGPGDSIEWAFEYVSPNAAVGDVIRATGAVLVGRRSYDVGRRAHQRDPNDPAARVYGGAWTGPQFVLTHELPDAPKDPTITFLSGNIAGAVARAKTAAAGRNLVLIGADVARQCIDAGLVDEILVHLAPVLVGSGVRFFERPGAGPVKLEKTSVAESGQITNLRFRVVK